MSENLREQFQILPVNLASHLTISMVSLVIGTCLSIPLAIATVRHARLRYPVLTIVSVVQTIPSLALLALMVPLLAALGTIAARWAGLEIAALGFLPTVIALTLYSMLPMVRNTVVGILEVNGTLLEAATGVGMSPRQILWKVQLPLAAPIIMAGIRTATVWVVGIATLATPVGQRCLGNYIFQGLQTRNWTAVIFGCVAAALLAIVLDVLLGGIQKAVKDRRRGLGAISGAALVALTLLGIFAPAVNGSARGKDTVVRVGTKTFTEQYILAAAISDVLDKAGFEAQRQESLGSTVVFDALAKGEIDCYVDYTGTIWANHMKRLQPDKPESVLPEVTDWLRKEYGIECLGPLGFENAYGIAMRREQAETLGVSAIGDLARFAPQMKIGGDYEFFGRPEWRSIRDAYGLSFASEISYDSTFMYEALRNKEVDVISAFTTDGRIDAYDLVILDDPRHAIPPYDAVLLLSRNAAKRPRLADTLQVLVGAIPVETIRHANYMVDREQDKSTVDQAASWLLDNLMKRPFD